MLDENEDSYHNHYSENLHIIEMDCIDITMDLTIVLYKYCAKITKCRESVVWLSSTLRICFKYFTNWRL